MQESTAKNVDSTQHKRAKLLAQFKKNQLTVDLIIKRDSPYAPLSRAQEPLWLMSQLEPDNPIYNVAGALEFDGALNTEALQQSLNEVIRRHEILRSRFYSEQGALIQTVNDFVPLCLQRLDFSCFAEDEAIKYFQQFTDDYIRAPFDLSASLPLRGLLVQLPNDKHILLLTLHHIVADRWSVSILMEEVASLYTHFGTGMPSALTELSIHYADYAAWQRQQTDSNDQHIDYWQQKLHNLSSQLSLPFDRARPPVASYKGNLYRFELSSELTESIKQLAKQHSASLFMVMASALNILLQRYSGSQDIAIGYTAAGRHQTQTGKLIGFFVNTLVLRSQLASDESFVELLKRIREQTLDDQAHQEVSYCQLVESVSSLNNAKRAPLFQVMLTVQNAPNVEFQLPGLTVKPVALENRVSQFDLTFLVEEQNGKLQVIIEYSTDLFDVATLARLSGHFTTLLNGIIQHPNKPLSSLPLLTDSEWQQTVIDWNRSAASKNIHQPLSPVPQWIAEQAIAIPDKTALIFATTQISYRELNDQANRLARHLLALGVVSESRVGVSAERSVELIIALLAILKAGAAYVPLDPNYPQDRLNYIIQDATIEILLVQSALIEQFQYSDCTLVDINDSYDEYSNEPLVLPAILDNTAYIIYTSGSTGQPKGVMVSHRNLRHSTLARFEYYQGSPACFLLLSSFGFDSSVAGIFWTLSRGGCLCLPEQEDINNPAALSVLIATHQVSHLLALPSFYETIINHSDTVFLNSLKAVIVAGEACTTDISNQHHRKLPSVQFYNEYGPTEATVWSSVYQSNGTEVVSGLPIGRPIDNVQIYILDKQYQPSPIGVGGELCIGGAGITQGYVQRPDITAEKFIPDPFGNEGKRLYKTGDLARFLADGNIEFLGRIDDQVKIRGFRIELGEIETRLKTFGHVQDAVVIACEDNSGDKRLVAYLHASQTIPIHELRNHLAIVLPEYMIPAAFVTLDVFPLTPNGKLDKRALPAPDLSAVATQNYVAPQTSAEITLAELWQELLGVEQVGRNDHFFELGGHSLMAISLIEYLQQRGYSADVMNVFNMPILADMAATLTDSQPDAFAIPDNLITTDCEELTPDKLTLIKLQQHEIDAIAAHVPQGISNIQDIYPLAPLQEGILFHHLLNTDNDAYLKRAVLRFDNRSLLDSFLNGLQIVIDRHDILRTAVYWSGLPQPVQVVQRQAQLPVIELELGTEDALSVLLEKTDPCGLRMNLQQAPLFIAYIGKETQNQQWLLSLINHHLIDDNYTLQLILSEIKLIMKGQAASLPVSAPYRNFVAQVHNVTDAEHEAYFREQLASIDEPTAPFGILDIQGDGRQACNTKVTLDDVLSQKIYDCARRQATSAAVLFHIAWAQVLANCCGRDDVVFGTVLSGRLQGSAGVNQALGVFINTLPICIGLGDRTIQQVVKESYQRLGNLLNHEQASLALAQRCSAVPNSMPLFTTLLNYRHSNLLDDQTELFNWEGITVLKTEEHTNYPVTLCVDDMNQHIILTAQCVNGINPERIVAYLETAISQLIDALSQQPTLPINRLSILPEQEYQQVIHGFNATEADYPRHRCIHQLFEQQVEKTPDAIALVYEEQQLSYQQLNQQANRLAHRLIVLGIRPDDRVALCVERSLEMVIGLLGILKAGGAYVPLDPSYPKDRLAYMLADCAPVALLTQQVLRTELAVFDETLKIPVILLDALNDQHDSSDTATFHNPDAVTLGLTSQHLAYVIYTSGSTGQPKGVMNQHQGVVNRLWWAQNQYHFDNNDRVLQKTPFSFDVSVWEFFLPLITGVQLVIAKPQGHQDPNYLADLIAKAHITTVHFVPSMLQIFLDSADVQACTSLRRVLCSGEALPYSLQLRFHILLPNIELHNLYGPTEAAIDVTSWLCHPEHTLGIVPIGYPIANTQLYILDSQLNPVPIGVTGELYIGGAGVARGYLNRPELTAERFIDNPFKDKVQGQGSARLYKTGDLGRWLPDGSIEYLGRNDFQVKIRGFRIELGEIEAQLINCAGVNDAVVIAREDVSGDKRLVAYLLVEQGYELSVAEVRSQLASSLAEYMLPSAFVTLDSFPLTPNGKLDRKALPVPDSTAVISRPYEAPHGETETLIADIWKELLHLEQVGRYDQFFELGGHSLLAVQLVSRVRQSLGMELALRELFAYPALADLAKVVSSAQSSQLPAVAIADRNQPVPLSWAQQRLWFLAQLDVNASQAYHIPAGLRLRGQLDKTALLNSLNRIVVRHEMLRTTFVTVDGQPRQRIADASVSTFTLLEHDLRGVDTDIQTQSVMHICETEVSESFNLETGPLIRGRLLQLADDEHVLLITQHHIISDGWSIGRLITEFTALYTAFSQGQDDPLPALTIQYADYTVWQRQWLQGAVLQAQIDFWKQQLTGAPELLELPTDFPRPAQQSYAGASVNFTLSSELTAQLKQFNQRHNVTLFMTLLTAWSVLLSRLSGQNDVVIGTAVANRTHADLENLIGFFVNTLAVRVHLEDQPTTAQLLEQVKATTLAAYSHQDLPFEQLVEIIKPMRSMSHSPLFQTMLTLDNTPAGSELTLPGLTLFTEQLELSTTQFDLSLSVTDAGDLISGNLQYASDLFTSATINRLIAYFQTLLTAMLEDNQQAVNRLPLLSPAETHQLLVDFNATEADYPRHRCIHQLFEQQVEKTPDAIALVYEEQQLSYQQLNQQANRLAHRLIVLGIRPDDRVALCVERSLEMVIGLLGILKAGGAYVPLDPSYPKDRLAYMLADCAPVALLTQQVLRTELAVFDETLKIPVILLDALNDQHDSSDTATFHNPDAVTLGLTSQHLAYVIYTSGSTGEPKGTLTNHTNVVSLFSGCQKQFQFTDKDVWTLFHSYGFDFSVWELWGALLYGGRLVVAPYNTSRNPDAFYRLITQQQVTVLSQTPSAFRQLIAARTHHKPSTNLRYIFLGGEALDVSLLTSWCSDDNTCTRDLRFINGYGPTETTIFATTYCCSAEHSLDIVPIGYPLGNTQLYILDSQLNPVPIGVTGELYIGGAGVARGYLNRPDLTAERFIDNPFSDTVQGHRHRSARLYKTGDLGRWLPDGSIEYLGRNDFQVKIRGFRIELGEIEAQLINCAGVNDAVVIAREDVPGDKRLAAYLLVEQGYELSVAEVRSQLASSLAEYMLPSAFVTLDSFPLTPNGKLDRKALPVPDSTAVINRPYEAPHGETENLIADIWKELLHLEQVGRYDQFFELGGHSLLAVQLAVRIRNKLDIEVPLMTIFQNPTITSLSEHVINLQIALYSESDISHIEEQINTLSEAELHALLSGESIQ